MGLTYKLSFRNRSEEAQKYDGIKVDSFEKRVCRLYEMLKDKNDEAYV